MSSRICEVCHKPITYGYMTVRELLRQIAPTLKTHEIVTLTSAPTVLYIDIEHSHYFHSLGKIDKNNLKENDISYNIERPFEHAFYKKADKMYSVLDDFEVYRWKIERRKDLNGLNYEWILEIETRDLGGK